MTYYRKEGDLYSRLLHISRYNQYFPDDPYGEGSHGSLVSMILACSPTLLQPCIAVEHDISVKHICPECATACFRNLFS